MTINIDSSYRIKVGDLQTHSYLNSQIAESFIDVLQKISTLKATARRSRTDWIAVVVDTAKDEKVVLSQYGYSTQESARSAALAALQEIQQNNQV